MTATTNAFQWATSYSINRIYRLQSLKINLLLHSKRYFFVPNSKVVQPKALWMTDLWAQQHFLLQQNHAQNCSTQKGKYCIFFP